MNVSTWIGTLGAAVLAFNVASAQVEGQGEAPDAETREELKNMAEEAVMNLREKNDIAAALWDDAYGYAVFDTTKGGLIVTGVGGTGVAAPKEDGDDAVFMHVGGAGVGLGAGLENYNLVLLIEDEQTFDEFVEGAWSGAIAAQAAAGEAGVTAEEQFVNGIAAFRLTEGGLMASADVTALRFWPSAELNLASIE